MKKLNVTIEDLERELEGFKRLEAAGLRLYDKGDINLEILLEEAIYYKNKIDETNNKLNKLKPIAKVVNACESGIVKVVRFFTDDID